MTWRRGETISTTENWASYKILYNIIIVYIITIMYT